MHRWLMVLFVVIGWTIGTGAHAADRPNIVWIVSEDNSKHHLKLFDAHGAAAPNIEKLAEKGIVFDRAFSCGPVCSVARTTLATCVFAPRGGFQFHRKLKSSTLPSDWRMFPYYLKQAGYYTTNNSKTDYNTPSGKGVWDVSSKKAGWKNRPTKDTPFFHMESHGRSHESSLHFKAAQLESVTTDPSTVFVPPYHPNTKTFRYTYARYHDRMKDIDGIVGKKVAEIKAAGLLEDTFIFYFGDHGGVLPGSKGYIWETGLHVPLVVRVPEKWKHLVAHKPGSRTKGFVNFTDFGATVLHLAGVKVPDHMDGKPFMGKGVTAEAVDARDEAYCYADRFDEKYEFLRSLRKGKYKYIRCYEGYLPDGLQNNYRYKMLAFAEWRKLHQAGKLDTNQRRFFEPKPVELLFDLEADPHEIKNLTGDPAHAKTLAALRDRLRERMKAMPDLSLFPESVLVDKGLNNAPQFGQTNKARIAKLLDAADLALLPIDQALPKLKAAFEDKDPWVRYWAATSCATLGKKATPLADAARPLLKDAEPLVRVRAADFLAIIGAQDPRPTLKAVLAETPSDVAALITLNSVVFVRDHLKMDIKVTKKDVKATGGQVMRRVEYLSK